MKTPALAAFSLASTSAVAHPGHGGKGWFHQHQDDLIEAAMIAVACLVAVSIVRLMWKVVGRPQ
jgi:hypothetical protein